MGLRTIGGTQAHARARRGPIWEWVEEVDGERRLDVRSMNLGDASLAEILRQLDANGVRLDRLDLWDNRIGAEGCRALMQSEATAQLRSLYLDQFELDDGAVAWLTKRTWPRLERLDLGAPIGGSSGLGAIAESNAFPRLRELAVAVATVREMDAVARSTGLARLQTLFLAQTVPLGLERLLSSGSLPALRELSLGPLNERGLRALMEAPTTRRLRSLELRLTAGASFEAFDSSSLPRLERLAVAGMEAEAFMAFVRSGLLDRLRALDLGDSLAIPVGGLRSLADRGGLDRLHELRVMLDDDDTESATALVRGGSALRSMTVHQPHGPRSPFSETLEQNRWVALERLYVEGADARFATGLVRSGLLLQLRSLHLQGHELGDEGATALAEHAVPTSLETLRLSRCEIGERGARALAASRVLEGVRELDLSHNPMGVDAGRALLASPHVASLEHLSLAYTGAVVGAAHMLGHHGHTRLRWLDFQTSLAEPNVVAAARSLASQASLPRLEGIDWGGAFFDEPTLRAFVATEGLPDRCVIGAHSYGRPVSFDRAPFTVRRQIDVHDAEGARRVAAEGVGDAHELRLRDIDDDALEVIAGGVELAGIRKLEIRSRHAGPRGMRALAGSSVFSRVHRLGIRQTPLGPEGVAALAVMPRWTDLRDLELQGVGANGLAIARLAESPALSRLTTLSLSAEEVGDEGLSALADGALRRLRVLGLYLGYYGVRQRADPEAITDVGIRALARTSALRELRAVELPPLSVEAARALGESRALDHLGTIHAHQSSEGAGAALLQGRGLPSLVHLIADDSASLLDALLQTDRTDLSVMFESSGEDERAALRARVRAVNQRRRNLVCLL